MTRTDRKTSHVRRTLELRPADWAALDTLAAEHNAVAIRGAGAGTAPAWSALVRMIARGELGVVNGILPTQEADDGMGRRN